MRGVAAFVLLLPFALAIDAGLGMVPGIEETTPCEPLGRCGECMVDSFCGWCHTNQKCIPGTKEGPMLTNCTDWSYGFCRDDSCAAYTGAGCETCISDPFCGFCGDNLQCMEGTENSPLFEQCDAWYGQSCPQNGSNPTRPPPSSNPRADAVAEGAAGRSVGADYYADINPNSATLKADLQALLKRDHTPLSYDDVWKAFGVIDTKLPCKGADNTTETHVSENPVIGDVYSAYCWDSISNRCGNFHKEGDCFNREHGWPKSWFGGFSHGHHAQTDLFLLWPADGKVNSVRGNLPLGNVSPDHASYTSSADARAGPCASEGFDGKCFEVPDEYKGDFARSYFYIATRYGGEFDCCDEDGVDGASIKDWMEKQLRTWHKNDPVSDGERAVTDIIFTQFQHNRSPFVDHPEWVELVRDF